VALTTERVRNDQNVMKNLPRGQSVRALLAQLAADSKVGSIEGGYRPEGRRITLWSRGQPQSLLSQINSSSRSLCSLCNPVDQFTLCETNQTKLTWQRSCNGKRQRWTT